MVLLCNFSATPDLRAILGDVSEPSVSCSFFNKRIIERRSYFAILNGRPLLIYAYRQDLMDQYAFCNVCIWKLACNWGNISQFL